MTSPGSMRGASAEALAALREELSRVVAETDPAVLADDLFGVSRLLRTEPALRRVTTDVSVDAAAKRQLVRGLLRDKVQRASLELVESAVGRRWTATRDLADALERLGEIAVVKSTDQPDRLADELFALEQAVTSDPGLRDALANPQRSTADKARLLRDLLADRALPATLTLGTQSLSGSYRTVTAALAEYQKVAAAEHDQRVAEVRVAHQLSDAERTRLQQALSRQYGRQVHLNVVVDPALVGGVRVEIGDDVIDGSVASRLDDARRRLAG